MDKFKEILSHWEVPRAQSKEEAWDQLSRKIDLSASPPSTVVRPLWRRSLVPLAAAASLALILWVVFSPSSTDVSHTTLAGSHSLVELPDGSTATLNASSELHYDAASWDQLREVSLKGEGFFNVEPGSSFIVQTSHGKVKVLGTSFNVFQRNDIFEVSCYTGKVAVDNKQQVKEIAPGECVRCDTKTMKLFPFDTTGQDWRNGHYTYDGVSLNRVLDEMAIQYNLEIKHRDFSDRPFFGSFKLNRNNPEETLSIICKAMDLEYEFLNRNQVVIR